MIKFRIWSILAKKFESKMCLYLDDSEIGDVSECFHNIDMKENYVLQQYIGLNDVEGREIFVGDIVQCVGPGFSASIDGVNFEVKACNKRGTFGITAFIFQSEDDILFNTGDGADNDRYSNLKIVGNIHEGVKL
jgi:uncharacterized phage protein (TIGR01671 family)